MLGGFVDGLTGAGVGALWDGGHCYCKPGVQKTSAVMPFLCGGIIRTGALEHLKVSFIKSSQTARTFLLIGDGKWLYCYDGF